MKKLTAQKTKTDMSLKPSKLFPLTNSELITDTFSLLMHKYEKKNFIACMQNGTKLT